MNKSWYINSKLTDTLFIVLCPLLALIIVAFICEPRDQNYIYNNLTPVWFAIGASVLTHAHVLLVFTRSHLNADVFKRYKYRFTLIPLLLLLLFCFSPYAFLISGAIAVYWDEWHSIMQTFGFGRIYDSKKGNDALAGRRLDIGMAFVVGLLPNLVLLTYLPQSQIDGAMVEYLEVPMMFARQYAWLITNARIPLIGFGVLYSLFYAFSYYRLIKNGYKYSAAKFWLFAVTGLTTVIISSIYTIADGVFFGNIYHAIQYIFIVLVSERTNLTTIVTKSETKKNNTGTLIFFMIILPLVFIFAGIRQITQDVEYLAAFWLLTSLMHFWFDGFIWSVRRQDLK